MKKSLNVFLATTFLATSLFTHNAMANEEASRLERLKEKVMEKIKDSRISASASLSLPLELDDVLGIRTGIRYQYVLDPDMGNFLRQDKWEDYVQAGLIGPVAADRRISRKISYGRFYKDWNVALKEFLFSPLDLKGLNAEVIKQKMKAGDMASVTFEKHTFLGLRGAATNGSVRVGGSAGKVFVGKITAKMLRRADNKVTISFANADENAIKLAANVKIGLIDGLLSLRLLDFDADFRLRGTADLASYTYDLNNPKALEVLNNVLASFDEPTILQNEDLLKEGVKLSTKLSKGLIDVTASEASSDDITSGITKDQKVNNSIVAGNRRNFQFKLIPNYLQSKSHKTQSVNLMDINLSGSFIKPGQYIVGYRSEHSESRSFGTNNRITNTSTVVYQPDPVLNNADRARGYRGEHDLVGISYHTDATQTTNVKELVTYAKLCNAGLIACDASIDLRVVAPEDSTAREAKNASSVNSNYFFSKDLFTKMKQRMNWSGRNSNEKSDAIKQVITPLIQEMVVSSDKAAETEHERKTISSMTSFFTEILENNCYTNLAGIDAQKHTGFKKLFENCGRNVYDIQDELVRLNMPALLIALYDPTILPLLNNPQGRASAEAKAELAKYFSVSFTNRYRTTEGVEKIMNGLSYGMSAADTSTSAAQVSEFTNLIQTWQRRQNLDYDQFDRILMLQQRGG
jgi:hypothetical protein